MKGLRVKFWIAGIAVAGIGVLLARVIPSLLTQPALKLASYLIGVALALTGLAILIVGMNRASGGSSKTAE